MQVYMCPYCFGRIFNRIVSESLVQQWSALWMLYSIDIVNKYMFGLNWLFSLSAPIYLVFCSLRLFKFFLTIALIELKDFYLPTPFFSKNIGFLLGCGTMIAILFIRCRLIRIAKGNDT